MGVRFPTKKTLRRALNDLEIHLIADLLGRLNGESLKGREREIEIFEMQRQMEVFQYYAQS